MHLPFYGRLSLWAVVVVFIMLAVVGGWGNVGAGDGALYRMVSACSESAPGDTMIKRCFSPAPTAALFPTLVLGISARISGAPLAGVIRFYGVALGLMVLLLVWELSRGRQDWLGGVVAVGSLLVATPLLDRVRSGGVEVWILALTLLLAKLLADSREAMWKSIAVMGVAALLFATHPYAGWALWVVLLVPLCTSSPEKPETRDGRVGFAQFGARPVAATFGALALFATLWPGFQSGPQLWRRLAGLFREIHPPFRFGGEVWVQSLDVGAPPFYATFGILLLSTSVVVVALVVLGVLHGRRDEEISLKPLLLLALAWLTVNSLQGSPFADGYDHRLPLLGLLIPFAGRGFRVFERFCAYLVPWPSNARSLALVAVVVGLGMNVVTTLQGHIPSSGLAPDSGAMVQMGGPAFMRPVFEPALVEAIKKLPAGTKLACSPWEEPCRRDIVPGIIALGLGAPGLRAARLFSSAVVVIPNDPAYITPPVLLQDFSGEAHQVADIYRGAWLRYAVRRTQSGAQGAPAGSLPR